MAKILYHHRTLGDGAEGIHVSAVVEAWRSMGHEVRIAAVIGEQTNISTSRTQLFKYVTHLLPRSVYEIAEIGYSLVGYRFLKKQLKNWQPGLLYERYALFNLAGLVTARRTGLPLILEVNSPLAYERAQYERLALQQLAKRCERFLCRRADHVVVVSTPLKTYLVDQGVSPDRITVLPNGVDPIVFRPNLQAKREIRERLGIPTGAVVLGFCGILRPWHGVELLLKAVRRIDVEKGQVYVLIVGNGPSQSALEEQAGHLGLRDKVVFTGRVLHDEIPRYLSAFDIGVSPRTTFYASPMKVPEYMATGLAVVAPRTPNLQDLVHDGVDGVLFRSEDVEDMSAALSALVYDPERRRRLGQQARDTVLAGRTWQHNAARILTLISTSNRAT